MATEQAAMAVLRASRPTFRNAHDKVAFAVHSAFLATGFSLVAVGPATNSDDLSSHVDEVGIDGWNEMEDRYGFLYVKEEKGRKMRILVKALVIGDKLPIDVVDLDEQKELLHLDFSVDDHVAEGEAQPKNYGDMYKNFKGLVESVNSAIMKKLEGANPDNMGNHGLRDMNASSSERRGRAGGSSHSECYDHPRVGSHPPTSEGVIYPPIVPPSGYSDVFPGPGAGFYPDRGIRGDGSMLIGNYSLLLLDLVTHAFFLLVVGLVFLVVCRVFCQDRGMIQLALLIYLVLSLHASGGLGIQGEAHIQTWSSSNKVLTSYDQ
ncbi:hypothetical protein LUZ63_000577 [Rhynchospora breviuscula]|uniref:PI31 proteasome regulator N-terminal domain-containing protein n=1 Tax=Rhynchospora breviuscula TaxID=2022672 RepID=A0A9Q0HX08_9POAL|nr:hypothetical protein LUZ63_000577 [Rhynchospora breviuscula]